jgi:competence protein ComGC
LPVNKTAGWTLTGAATVVAAVIAFQTWATDNFVTQSQMIQKTAEQNVLHDKQYLARMLDHNETRLELAELRIEGLENSKDLSSAEERTLRRLKTEALYYRTQLLEIRKRLRLGE